MQTDHNPMKQLHPQKSSLIPIVLAGLASLGLAITASAQYITPYTGGSTADNQLNFNNGAAGSVTAPAPAFTLGLAYSNTPGSGSGGGWSLGASGTVTFGLGITIVGSSSAQTAVSSSELNFDFVTSGLGNLAGASLPMTWSATSNITGSNLWASPSTQYRYQFDVALSESLVSLSPSIFGSITLTIKAGSNTLYQVTGLSQILGIVSITDSIYDDVQVGFNYDQADGPLSITWSAASTVSASLLGILGDGTNSMYQVSNGSLAVAVPEPSTYALMLGACSSLFLLRRRRI
jgi:hypothetical protein